MVAEPIEGEVIERGLTVVEAHPVARLEGSQTPEDMVRLASRMATALKDIVDRQKLYAVIQGKKYPQVEAWMTIARMDNVVARESEHPIRHDDGSYEAFVELIRLSDAMVIGSASALCGTADDSPWNKRSEPARRSMAVTRATSRAFRQQYSWIMALAGYEPTPAEEMPRDDAPAPRTRPASAAPARTESDERSGIAEVGKGQADFELRQTPNGWALAFRLVDGRKGIKAVAVDAMAEWLAEYRAAIEGAQVTCWGAVTDEAFTPKDADRPVKYQVLHIERIETPVGAFPAPAEATASAPPSEGGPQEPDGFDAAWGGPLDGPR